MSSALIKTYFNVPLSKLSMYRESVDAARMSPFPSSTVFVGPGYNLLLVKLGNQYMARNTLLHFLHTFPKEYYLRHISLPGLFCDSAFNNACIP